MDPADDLELRWLHLDASQAGAGPATGTGAAAGPAPGTSEGPERLDRLDRHDLSNAVTAIAGAARLLCDRWDELGEAERKELAAMVLRRAEELRRALDGAAAGAAGASGAGPRNS